MNWKVYIIKCSDDTLYTGISNDIEKRFQDHLDGNGAKYFRGREPKELVYIEEGHSRSSASKRELEIKKLTRKKKDRLINLRTEQPLGYERFIK